MAEDTKVESCRYVQSADQHEEYPGQTLVTRAHEVIRAWAETRDARPATVPGSEHDGHAGVLRFDFNQADAGLEEIKWEQWFRAFDQRGLNFIYQEHRADGATSNFFRLEDAPHPEAPGRRNDPGREDA
ncbi:MAG: hypothetical protein M0R73_06400 [Dehalococcoidia bacterium]|nr:hypothetical protein [Dehalococcoidia bacterium]